jgi:hypothetical protein
MVELICSQWEVNGHVGLALFLEAELCKESVQDLNNIEKGDKDGAS